ncbi:MAG TPA: hypothetical protein VKU82_08085 [Planctomycetaceae bacterium]|nr:hypothetical protein [Planctomycetaceae bacterium]
MDFAGYKSYGADDSLVRVKQVHCTCPVPEEQVFTVVPGRSLIFSG